MHWHPNADEWQYYLKGKARMTVFDTGPNALTMDFNAGDIGYVRRNLGHYVENVGDTDLQFIGVFRAPRYEEVVAVQLADAYAAGTGGSASQRRRSHHREVARQRPRHHAEIVKALWYGRSGWCALGIFVALRQRELKGRSLAGVCRMPTVDRHGLR